MLIAPLLLPPGGAMIGGEGDATAVPKAAWVVHIVIPWERLERIAERYGVTEEEILRWNDLDPTKRRVIYSGKRLRIFATRFPPPRQHLTHVVEDGQTWRKIARKYGHGARQVKRWNPRQTRKRLTPGDKLTLWMDSSLANPALGRRGPPVPEFEVPSGGLSVGRPNRGKLIEGVKLPESDHYRIRIPYQSYGTSLTVLNLQKAIATFRYRTAFEYEIVIGAMSRRVGRRLRPHKSHQSGRDVDVRLPAMPHARKRARLRSDDVDWHAAWALIEAFVDTGAVQSIYLERQLQRRLRRAAKGMGANMDRINAIIHPNGVVRHSPGHTGHIHIRFRCSLEATRCRR
jgi:LysM repeat protein